MKQLADILAHRDLLKSIDGEASSAGRPRGSGHPSMKSVGEIAEWSKGLVR